MLLQEIYGYGEISMNSMILLTISLIIVSMMYGCSNDGEINGDDHAEGFVLSEISTMLQEYYWIHGELPENYDALYERIQRAGLSEVVGNNRYTWELVDNASESREHRDKWVEVLIRREGKTYGLRSDLMLSPRDRVWQVAYVTIDGTRELLDQSWNMSHYLASIISEEIIDNEEIIDISQLIERQKITKATKDELTSQYECLEWSDSVIVIRSRIDQTTYTYEVKGWPMWLGSTVLIEKHPG